MVIVIFSLNSWGWERCPETFNCSAQSRISCSRLPICDQDFLCLHGIFFCWIWAHCLLSCHLLLNSTKKNLACLLNPSHQVFIFICLPCPNPPTAFSPAFVFSRLNHHNFLRLSLSVRCWYHLCGLCWICSCVSLSPVLGSWAQSPRCVLALLVLLQPRGLLPALLQRCSADLWSPWCPVGLFWKT